MKCILTEYHLPQERLVLPLINSCSKKICCEGWSVYPETQANSGPTFRELFATSRCSLPIWSRPDASKISNAFLVTFCTDWLAATVLRPKSSISGL